MTTSHAALIDNLITRNSSLQHELADRDAEIARLRLALLQMEEKCIAQAHSSSSAVSTEPPTKRISTGIQCELLTDMHVYSYERHSGPPDCELTNAESSIVRSNPMHSSASSSSSSSSDALSSLGEEEEALMIMDEPSSVFVGNVLGEDESTVLEDDFHGSESEPEESHDDRPIAVPDRSSASIMSPSRHANVSLGVPVIVDDSRIDDSELDDLLDYDTVDRKYLSSTRRL
jgi:hypothetical protein